MTLLEKKRKAAAIAAATAVAMEQMKARHNGDSRWGLMGINRNMQGRNVTHLYGRGFGTFKW